MTDIESIDSSHGRTARISLLLAAVAIIVASGANGAEVVGSARLNVERASHTATLLGKGTVLLVGGRNAAGPTSVAEIYDPLTRTFSVAGSSLEPRAGHAAVRLADGRVLVIGGRGAGEALASTELFDPKTRTFSAGPFLWHARSGHTATLLADGRVVVVGGDAAGSAEIYEPATGLFHAIEDCLSLPRSRHAAVLLRDGNVLVAGGVGADGAPLASAEILNVESLSFSDSPIPMLTSRALPTLRLLPDGKVQAIGGDREATMELFNPSGRYFSSLGHLGQDPAVFSAALRNTGRAALIGSPASSRPALAQLSSEGVELDSKAAVLEISSYTLTELPGTNAAVLIGGLTAGALQSRAVLFDASSATVTTDKSDYAPGETVTITGTGWLPGETVTLNLHRDTNDPPDTVLTAVVDANGNFTNSEYVCQEFDLGVTFILTATGQTSGYTAQTTFTDGNPQTLSILVGQTPNPVAAGSAATYTVRLTFTGNGNNCTVNLTATPTASPAWPGGVTFLFTPSQLTGHGQTGGSPRDSVLTITTPAAMAADTYNFVVAITYPAGHGCQNTNANPTANGTLVVTAAPNAAPVVATPVVTPEPSDEGGAVNVSATFTDSNTAQTHTCTVNWGDGSPVQAGTVTEASGSGTCNAGPHTYVDDNPTSTSSDLYTVTVTVTDVGAPTPNLSGSNTASHTVNNVPPVINNGDLSLSAASISENGSVNLSGTFTDPGVQDTHTVTINWGDGSSNTTIPLAAGVTSFGPSSHTYLDDNPTGTTSDAYTITVTVTDDDTGSDNATASVTVNNANPVVATPTTNSPTFEGSLATASATFTDAGTADTHTCSINWGDGSLATVGTVTQGAGSGSCSGSHTYADEGTGSYTVTFTITDDDGGSGNNSVSHTVVNVPPTITNVSVSPEPSIEGNLDTVTATFTDPGTADVHTCSINWGDGSPVATGTVAAGSCSGTHTYADNGSYTVSVTIDDGDGGSDSDSTLHVVGNANPSITLITVTPEPSNEGSLASLSATFTDAGTADTHTCTINWGDGSPTVAGTVTQGSGSGSCSGSHTYADEGSFTVTVTVTDDDTGSDTDTTTHVVLNLPPSVGAVTVSPEPSNEGQSVTASASFTDPGVNDTHTCTVDYGDGSGPLPGTVSAGTCTGPAHVYADEGTGSYTVTVSVSDTDGGTGSNTGSHSVLNVAPTVATPTVVPSSSNEGQSVTASATFTDPGTLDTHTCTVNYGDGSGALAGTVVGNLCTGPAHTYVDDGTFTVTVTVTDNDGGPGSNTTSHTVANLPPVVGAVTTNSPTAEGSLATASASFTDPGTADTHTCSINWGDGSPASSGTVTQGAGSGSCSGSHTYADEGTGSYTVTITIDDGDGGSDDNSASHTVTNVPPVVAVPTTDSPTNEGASASATATFTDAGTADVHTCTVNWGDGSAVETGTVTEASGSGSCTDSHVYGDNGTFTVTVTINDGDGGVTSNSTTHVVNNVAPTVGAVTVSPEPSVEGGAVTASASFTDPGANDAPFTCTVNYGDGSGALAGTVAGNTCTGPSHVYVDEGTGSYTVTVSVTDKNGDTGSNSGSHAVTNAPPVITAIVGPMDPIQIGGSATITASFTDAGTADTHTCSINWGTTPATITAGTVVESSGSGTCSGSHTYATTGVYTVTVTVTDNDGGSDTETYSEYVVIFDPNGGFVTGGGWINSPAGAYAADPAAVGRANFGFVSKYKRGASGQLEGETEFQFKAGDLNFHSTSYEWMVISGAKARYRGVGTINGSGSYSFELTAWDAQVSGGGGGLDRFRIRIYGVYDNQLGAPDGVDPTTTLGGGSIVIHKPK